MRRCFKTLCLLLFLLGAAGAARLHAQKEEPALSDGEVEKLRESAADAPSRVMVFVEFLNRRADRIDKLNTGKRLPGREEDTHALIQEMSSILDDLEDNLEDYNKRHWDIRKALPKLLSATERWNTTLNSAPDREEYGVQRKLALESLHDVRETATAMVEEQKAWFKEHPPAKEAPGMRPPG